MILTGAGPKHARAGLDQLALAERTGAPWSGLATFCCACGLAFDLWEAREAHIDQANAAASSNADQLELVPTGTSVKQFRLEI